MTHCGELLIFLKKMLIFIIAGTDFNQDHYTGPKVSKACLSYFDRSNFISTSRNNHGGESVSSCRELKLNEDNLDIPWSELVLKKKIGKGTCYF